MKLRLGLAPWSAKGGEARNKGTKKKKGKKGKKESRKAKKHGLLPRKLISH